jgi:hypothetical protein
MAFHGKQKMIKAVSLVLNITSIITLLLWLINLKFNILGVSIDLEALFVLLTTVAVFLNQLHRWLLAEAEYSPAYALALGYVNNFIEPAITQLIEDGISQPLLYIYKPEGISELYKPNIDRVKATIKNNSFELNELQLELKHGRARDILTIQKSKTKLIYFDFPNTLLSLSAYIDFKIASKINEATDIEKKQLTKLLLNKFYNKVDELVQEKNIQQNIKYCNKNLVFNF